MVHDKIFDDALVSVVLTVWKNKLLIKDLIHIFCLGLDSIYQKLSPELAIQCKAKSSRGKQGIIIHIFHISRFPKACYPSLGFFTDTKWTVAWSRTGLWYAETISGLSRAAFPKGLVINDNSFGVLCDVSVDQGQGCRTIPLRAIEHSLIFWVSI
jgi:hypothetical protein